MMEEISLENKEIKLTASKNERIKSLVNFSVLDKSSNIFLFELYSENDNLVDGNIKIKVNYLRSEMIKNVKEKLKCAVKLFTDFCFINWPLKNIYYETYQNDILTINVLMELGFVVEANLKQDYYYDGKFINRMILTLHKK